MKMESLLVELGTEELPPRALKTLGLAFRDSITAGLGARHLAFGDAHWFATPRRLAVLVAQVQLQAPDREVEVLGPPADRARDASGNWTPAAAGFAAKQGVDPDQLQVLDSPKGPRLGLRSTVPGVRAQDCLGEIVRDSIERLPIPRRMRWGAHRFEFVRPVHWVVLMLGQDAEHGEVLGLPTGNRTRGHRIHSKGTIELARPEDYPEALAAAKVVADFEQRRQMIRDQVEVEASALQAQALVDADLLDEVTGLVEWPVALTGSFEERFLAVPPEALISSMQAHQKYFPVVDGEGRLMPHFITIANLESRDPIQVIAGNERVIRPRLSDAAFFYETDRKRSLASRLPGLGGVVFQQQLGTLLDKTRRVERLVELLAGPVGARPALARRAAELSKTDLLTDMVLEFPDLQGIAGSYYALHDGEDADVAAALAQQYWPRFAGDRLPERPVACALGLADRLDTLVGIFGIGQPPTGSKDPFALRRASLAVLRILVEQGLELDLRPWLERAASGYPSGTLAPGTADDVLAYLLERFRARYEEDQIPVEVFRAVHACGLTVPLDIDRRVRAVHAFTRLPEAAALAAANKRVANILGKLEPDYAFGKVNANLLVEPEEMALAHEIETLGAASRGLVKSGEYEAALACLAQLRAPVDAFFDGVMVNAEDPELRDNRLNLLRALRELFVQVADISQLAVAR